jgi:Cdc6-like AAA superfamily ATPase
MLAGRLDEIQRLEHALFQPKHGNPAHFIIQGERGIGKSSLLFYLNAVAQGHITAPDSVPFKFLTVEIELEPANSDLDILRKMATTSARACRAQSSEGHRRTGLGIRKES